MQAKAAGISLVLPPKNPPKIENAIKEKEKGEEEKDLTADSKKYGERFSNVLKTGEENSKTESESEPGSKSGPESEPKTKSETESKNAETGFNRENFEPGNEFGSESESGSESEEQKFPSGSTSDARKGTAIEFREFELGDHVGTVSGRKLALLLECNRCSTKIEAFGQPGRK